MAVHSITFTGSNSNDYLLDPHTEYVLRKGKTYEEYETALSLSPSERTKKYGRNCRDIHDFFFKEVKKGLENALANKCLINRTFNFSTDKINVIFGPNASGKSTILKAIAANALCGRAGNFDGYTNILHSPIDIGGYKLSDEYTVEDVVNYIYKNAKNSADISWDGNPVYYHNFENRRRTGSVNDFEGSIFGSLGYSILYVMNKEKMNSGKDSLYMFEQIFNVAEQNPSADELLFDSDVQSKTVNSTHQRAYQVQKEYLLSKYDYAAPHQNTILLDEVDKHLDIPSTINLFKNILPALQQVNNQQLIVVTHSPFILSDSVCAPEKYNIIYMDKTYAENVNKILNTIKFN